jgi:uncharacterized protein
VTAARRTPWVVTASGLAGAALLAASLSVRAGSRQFYLLTAGLACTWAGGALAADPCHRPEPQSTATCRTALWSCPC